MRIIHTSDWHVGRRFLGNSTLEHLDEVLTALASQVRENAADVVVVAGDIFDTAAPSAEAYELLSKALTQISAAGAQVIMTSGNHDSASRLGFLSGFTAASGLHLITNPTRLTEPVIIEDEHGPVYFFGIPFLEPLLIRHLAPELDINNQQAAIEWAMGQIRSALPAGARSVVISHTFAANVSGPLTEAEKGEALAAPRDFTAGGVDVVSTKLFDGITYTALGHLHGRQELSPAVRYSGAPLFYAFNEVGRDRGTWLIELNADGLGQVEWLELPIPRQISQISGELETLLTSKEYNGLEDHWIKAVLTDNTRQLDAMRRLQTRYPYCIELTHEPANVVESDGATYSARVKALSDREIAARFLEHVRNGEAITPAETELMNRAIKQYEAEALR